MSLLELSKDGISILQKALWCIEVESKAADGWSRIQDRSGELSEPSLDSGAAGEELPAAASETTERVKLRADALSLVSTSWVIREAIEAASRFESSSVQAVSCFDRRKALSMRCPG